MAKRKALHLNTNDAFLYFEAGQPLLYCFYLPCHYQVLVEGGVIRK